MDARIALVEPGVDPALAALEEKIVHARGRISPLYRALLQSPAIADGWEALLTAVRTKTSLRADLRELVILRVAVLNGAPFEFYAHVPHARKAGVGDAKIAGVKLTPLSAPFDDCERAVLAYTDAITRAVDVADEVFERVAAYCDARTIVELTTTIAAYNMVSRFLVALRIGMDAHEHVG